VAFEYLATSNGGGVYGREQARTVDLAGAIQTQQSSDLANTLQYNLDLRSAANARRTAEFKAQADWITADYTQRDARLDAIATNVNLPLIDLPAAQFEAQYAQAKLNWWTNADPNATSAGKALWLQLATNLNTADNTFTTNVNTEYTTRQTEQINADHTFAGAEANDMLARSLAELTGDKDYGNTVETAGKTYRLAHAAIRQEYANRTAQSILDDAANFNLSTAPTGFLAADATLPNALQPFAESVTNAWRSTEAKAHSEQLADYADAKRTFVNDWSDARLTQGHTILDSIRDRDVNLAEDARAHDVALADILKTYEITQANSAVQAILNLEINDPLNLYAQEAADKAQAELAQQLAQATAKHTLSLANTLADNTSRVQSAENQYTHDLQTFDDALESWITSELASVERDTSRAAVLTSWSKEAAAGAPNIPAAPTFDITNYNDPTGAYEPPDPIWLETGNPPTVPTHPEGTSATSPPSTFTPPWKTFANYLQNNSDYKEPSQSDRWNVAHPLFFTPTGTLPGARAATGTPGPNWAGTVTVSSGQQFGSAEQAKSLFKIKYQTASIFGENAAADTVLNVYVVTGNPEHPQRPNEIATGSQIVRMAGDSNLVNDPVIAEIQNVALNIKSPNLGVWWLPKAELPLHINSIDGVSIVATPSVNLPELMREELLRRYGDTSSVKYTGSKILYRGNGIWEWWSSKYGGVVRCKGPLSRADWERMIELDKRFLDNFKAVDQSLPDASPEFIIRLHGVSQTLLGVVEVIGSIPSALAPEVTVSKAAAVYLVVNGFDDIQAGVRKLFWGEPVNTIQVDSVQFAATPIVGAENAQTVANVFDFSKSIATGIAVSRLNKFKAASELDEVSSVGKMLDDVVPEVAPRIVGSGEYVPNPMLELVGRGQGQAAAQKFRPWLKEGVARETARLDAIGKGPNTIVWRPELADIESSAFKIIVGTAKKTPKGEWVGTKFDSVDGGLLEIKHGSSVLGSSYQLRLQTYYFLKNPDNIPELTFTLQSQRPINSAFEVWLKRWGVIVEKIK
jgi:hypothetical protein